MVKGQILIYQGEGKYGCTGNDEFHDIITNAKLFSYKKAMSNKLNKTHVNFASIHDRWYIYKKR